MANNKILIRGYTAAQWVGAQGDPVLSAREIGIVTDTGRHVFGDGSTAFSGLTQYGGAEFSGLPGSDGQVLTVQADGTIAPEAAAGPSTTVDTVTESTTARTLALTDAGKIVESTSASATTITVPPNSSVAFPVGTVVGVYSSGAGGVTIAAGSGVTIRNLAALSQYGETSLRKRATDEWVQA